MTSPPLKENPPPPGVVQRPDGTYELDGETVKQDSRNQWRYADGKFLKGQKFPPVPKGYKRKEFGHKFVSDFLDDWQEHGKEALKACRENYPHMYVKVAAQLMPKQTEVEHKVGDTFIELLREISDQRKRLETVDAEFEEVEQIPYNA